VPPLVTLVTVGLFALFAVFVVRAFFSARAAASAASRCSTAASSRCARKTTSANQPPPRRWPFRPSNARIAASHRWTVKGLYAPRSTSSFVAPAVSSAASSSTADHPSGVRGRSKYCSSNSVRCVPRPLSGTYGTTCFCPDSARAANHRRGAVRTSTAAAVEIRRSHARMAGLSPFDAMSSGSPSAQSTE